MISQISWKVEAQTIIDSLILPDQAQWSMISMKVEFMSLVMEIECHEIGP